MDKSSHARCLPQRFDDELQLQSGELLDV